MKFFKIFSSICLLALFSLISGRVWGQIYFHDFGTTDILVKPFNGAPNTFATNLSTSSWTTSASGWSGLAGNSGESLSLSNSSGTPTYTLTFNVAAGFQVAITHFNFWRQRSTTGAQNWDMTINSTSVGSGTVPTTGAALGSTAVNTPISGLTGTVTVVLTMSGASSTGSFRLDDFTLTGSVTSSSSSSSNIITTAGFTPPTNIDYTAYQGTTLTTANSIEVAQFTIQDGGGSADADALATELTALTLSVANSGGLRRIALFDGSTNLKEVAGGSSAAFTNLTLSAADNGSKTFSVRVSFLSSVTDNQQFSFTVNSATANSSNSTFAAANAGGAVTSTSGDNNRIEVATTDIIFDQNVSNVAENAAMSPSLTIRAVDNNANFDLDNTSNVVMTISSGSTTFGGTATTTVAMVAGTATFSNLVFSTPANTNALTATQGALTDVSIIFNVTASAPEINVKQNVTSLVSGSGSHTASSIVSGNSGSAITFTIENLGSANLTYSSITSSNTTDFTLDLTSASSPVLASGNTTFTVTFNPTTAGAKSTTITINNNDTNEGTYTFTVTGTGTVSSASDIITNAGFSYSSNIAYASFQTASTLITGNSVAVNGLTLRDGGATTDADNLATTLTAISFTTGGSTAVRTAALFDGTTNIAEVAVNGATTISFSGLTLTAADASTKNFELRVTYQSTVTDNQQITFTVSSASASASTSGFAAANAGAAASSATSDINRLEVTADRLAWVQQPSAVNTGANMSPSPTISANDANSNRDLDYTSTITLTPSASTISTGGSIAAVSGLATFSGMQFSSAVNGVTLSGADGLLIPTGNSSSFNITIQEPGLLLLEDNFTSTGALTDALAPNLWTQIAATSTNPISTVNGNGLSYSNYGSSNIGNAAIMTTSGQDVYRTFTSQNPGSGTSTIYLSAIVSITSTQTGGDYFLTLGESSTFGSSATYRARIYLKQGSTSSKVLFGISTNGTSGTISYGATEYNTNTPILLAVKHVFTTSTSTSSLFINPSTTSEPASADLIEATPSSVAIGLDAIVLRQGGSGSAPALVVDGIRVATNWGTLVGNPQYSSSNNIAAGNYNNINVISGTLTATGNVTVHGTTTNDGNIDIGLNKQLTLNGTLTNNGTLTIESGATFLQGPSSTITSGTTGTFNVKQIVTGAGGATPTGRFWYMGVPLNDLTRGAAFGTAGPDNRLWSWTESGPSQWSSQIGNAATLTPTTGYAFRTGADATLNFSGTSLYSSNVSLTGLSNSGGSFAGCHLRSNPYTAYLDWQQVFTASTNISSTYCIPTFNGSSMVYDTYNATSNVAVNPSNVAMTSFIAPMQAFWVVVNPSTQGTLNMTKAMLSHQAGAVGLKDITSFPAFARLNLVSGDFYDQVVVYTDANATSEFEEYDSKKFFLPNKAQVYCPVGNDKLVINALKQGKAQTSAPLTVELPSTQVYKFEMAESFVENGLVVLEDKQEKIFQDMGVNPIYEFYGNSGVIADRFVLHFQLPNGTNNGGQVGNGGLAGVEDLTSGQIAVIANHDGAVTVELSADLTISGDIQIFDGAGRLVAQKAITRAQTNIQLNNGMGVYFVSVQTPMKTEMKKVMVY